MILRDCHIELSKGDIGDSSIGVEHLNRAIELGDLFLEEFINNDMLWSQFNLMVRLAKARGDKLSGDASEPLQTAEELLAALADSDEPAMPAQIGLGWFRLAEAKRELDRNGELNAYYEKAIEFLRYAKQESPGDPEIEDALAEAIDRLSCPS